MKTLQKYKNIPKSLKLMSKIIHFQKTFSFFCRFAKLKEFNFYFYGLKVENIRVVQVTFRSSLYLKYYYDLYHS